MALAACVCSTWWGCDAGGRRARIEAASGEPLPSPVRPTGLMSLTARMPPHANPLVLEHRSLDGKPSRPWSLRKTLGVGAGLLLLGPLLVLGLVVYLVALLGKLDIANESDWPALWALLGALADRVWQSAASAPWYRWIEPIGWLLALPAVLLLYRSIGQSRLHFEDDEVRMVSGLPAWLDVGPWGSWSMPYKEITSVDLVNYRAGHSYGPRPLHMAALQFNNRVGKAARRLAVAPWHRLGEGMRPKLESTATWLGVSLGTWKSEQDQQTLQNAYNRMPLVLALRQRGVAVPVLAQGRGSGGDDLFENPRMKALILLAFALAPTYFAGAFLLREYWVVAPPFGFWIALGLCTGIASALWVRGAAPAHHASSLQPPDAPGSSTVLANQLIVSMLFGLSAMGAAMAGVPLVSQWLFPAEDAVFVVRKDSTLDPVEAARGLPSFLPEQSIDFWRSRKPGTQYTLLMRKLPWGYWQYGVDTFRPEIEAFECPTA
jgi:hypothetical protein